MLLNLYSQFLFKKALEGNSNGIKVNGVQISTIRYSVSIVDSDFGLQNYLNLLGNTCEQFWIKINVKKAKIMTIQRKQNIPLPMTINNTILEEVYEYKY